MPVSSAGHLPHITSTSYPALVSYLASNYNAQRISNWSITIRTLRSSYENSKESGAGGGSPSRPKVMYIVSLSEFPADTFILIEDGEKDTRARVKARILEHRQQQDILMNQGNMEMAPLPLTSISQLQTSLQKSSTRYTLFASSIYYPLLLSRLNLPAPLGAPSMGDGGVSSSSGQGGGGPGAWLPRGKHIVIEGATYDLPSATRYGVEESIDGNNCEWRVRLGMIQSGGSRSSGAIMENEYLPLLRLSDPLLLLSHLHGLFPSYLISPTQDVQAQAINGITIHYPTSEQWDEVIPSSNQDWIKNLNEPIVKDKMGWKGKERGRRLAYLYITLLKTQGIL